MKGTRLQKKKEKKNVNEFRNAELLAVRKAYRSHRKILRISYKDHVTDKEVGAKIQQAIGPHEDLLTIVGRRKLK